MNFVQPIDEDCLPTKFKNVIQKRSAEDECIIRSAIFTMQDCNAWVAEFANRTSTQWITRTAKPYGSQKIDCQKRYVCHRSAFQKRPIDDRNNNKRGISKSTACSARMIVTVKVTTRNTRRTDEFIKKGMPGIIRISMRHNHPINCPSALKFLSPPTTLKEEFHEYFKMGMNISTSSHYHESKLLLDDEYNRKIYDLNNSTSKQNISVIESENIINNPRFNPRKRSIQNWFSKWRKEQSGSRDGVDLQTKLDENIARYASEGTTVRYVNNIEESFALAVLTPLMKRVHQSSFAKDILFIDTTSCYGRKKYAVTFLLTATPCGAIPCGVIITKDQTKLLFTAGFQMVQDIVTDEIGATFHHQNYPNVVMTDNCSAEIEAALTVWPSSISLLCISNVLQDVLRWLEDDAHKIPKLQQRDFISTFETILYCTDKEEAENAFESAIAIAQGFPAWQNYLRDQYKRKEKWCLAYRVGETAHHANNYAEISIRLFKENVLDRIKRYNVVALLDFVVNTIENFFTRKLKEFYSSKDKENDPFLEKVSKKPDYLHKENIKIIDEYSYEVPSENTPGEVYVVNCRLGMCSCKAGCHGKLCEHIAAVYKFFDLKCNNIPSVTMEGRRTVAFIAFGEDTEESELLATDCEPTQNATSHQCDNSVSSDESIGTIQEVDVEQLTTSSDDELSDSVTPSDATDDESIFKEILCTMVELNEKFGANDVAKLGVRKLFMRLREIKSADEWNTFLHTAAKSVPPRHAIDSKIKVQPTTIARRKLRSRR